LNYTEIEKIAYVILISSRKLKHYFQAHEIIVPSSQPLEDIFSNKEAFERIGKWEIELSQFDLNYVPRTAIKSQALADFMADWTPSVNTIQMGPSRTKNKNDNSRLPEIIFEKLSVFPPKQKQ
jgi:hypothetical protein